MTSERNIVSAIHLFLNIIVSCEQVLNKSSISEKGHIKNYNLKMLLSLLALNTISQFYAEMGKI
jgi:hypothetical protein